MTKKRAFISFDYDHDEALKIFLIGQSKHDDSSFELADWSIKEHIVGNWKEKARLRVRSVDVVIIICGEYTNSAIGVNTELQIAQEEGKPYFLLRGYPSKQCMKPAAAKSTDKLYNWTWDNLKALIHGNR